MTRHAALFLTPALLMATACAGKTVPLGETTDGGGASASGGSSGAAGGGSGGATGGTGGVAGNGGNGGSGGDTLANDGTQATSKKLDLLLVVDNSASMADKQQILGDAAPYIVDRLTNPRCVGTNGAYLTPQPTTPDAPCPSGSTRELAPVTDMHIGVVSSSLGSAGATICTPPWSQFNPTQDDHGHLLGVARQTPSYNGSGYLAWDPNAKLSPPGESNAATLAADLQQMITAAGESGCGYEATLESMYHFLVDPAPWQSVAEDPGTQKTTTSGVDQSVLAERASFLRPDSAVMVVVLTDENDCSIIDDGLGWLVGHDGSLPSATSVCATNPDDKCCHSCGLPDPTGCSHDPICDSQPTLPAAEDALNLRCFDQKRRFGLDLLYPAQRYANALRMPQICPQNHDLWCAAGDTPVPNPLFAGGRSPSLVSFEVITGVPWQDVARKPDASAPLSFMTANELIQNGRWSTLLGDPTAYKPPADPFMLESIDPRNGSNPITGAPIEPPSAAYNANDINGREWTIAGRDDLQYACTFPLATPKDCSDLTKACDCGSGQQGDKPLCQDPATGKVDTSLQYAAKAYPGQRQLDVARALGYKGIAASICASNTSNKQAADYGYNPAVQAMIERLNRVLH